MSNNSPDGRAPARSLLFLYGATIFVASAILLVLETAVERLVARLLTTELGR